MEFAFRRRYSLPPTDPRYLNATVTDILVDYWAHRYVDDPEIQAPVQTDGYEDEARAMAIAAGVPDSDFETVAEDTY